MKERVAFKVGHLRVDASVDEIFASNFDQSYEVYYNKNPRSLLNALCDLYGSDKGEISTDGHPYHWPSHSYADFMERTYGHCRSSVQFVFECGIGTNNPNLASSMGVTGKPGASLRVWRDYFPSAQIVGADIDANILFSEDRITTYHCDQTKPESIKSMWDRVPVERFDLMIDDGLHEVEAGACLFENSFHKLREGGLYIIEDVPVSSLFVYKDYFERKKIVFDFVNLYRKNTALMDNSLVVIRK